jgi:hypothetical protein
MKIGQIGQIGNLSYLSCPSYLLTELKASSIVLIAKSH